MADFFDEMNGAAELLTPVSVGITEAAGRLPMPGTAIQKTGTQYVQAVAVQLPRDLRQVAKDLMLEAELLGESAYYSWSVKDKQTGRTEVIEGPSVDLAMAAVRSWRNCSVDYDPVQETPTAYFYTARFIDIERGVVVSRPFRQARGWQVYGKMDEFRKEDIRFQIGASKAARNVVLNYVPKSIIKMAMDKAKEGVRNKIEKYIKDHSLVAAQAYTLKELAKVGVTEERVLATLSRPTAAAIDIDDLVRLRGDLRAIQDGAEMASSLFPEGETKPSGTQAQSSADAKKDKIREAAEAATAEASPGQTTLEAFQMSIRLLLKGKKIKEDDYLAFCLKVIGVEKEAELTQAQREAVIAAITSGELVKWASGSN